VFVGPIKTGRIFWGFLRVVYVTNYYVGSSTVERRTAKACDLFVPCLERECQMGLHFNSLVAVFESRPTY
jgi:hypothetical protein